jgi:hypothetical protein
LRSSSTTLLTGCERENSHRPMRFWYRLGNAHWAPA